MIRQVGLHHYLRVADNPSEMSRTAAHWRRGWPRQLTARGGCRAPKWPRKKPPRRRPEESGEDCAGPGRPSQPSYPDRAESKMARKEVPPMMRSCLVLRSSAPRSALVDRKPHQHRRSNRQRRTDPTAEKWRGSVIAESLYSERNAAQNL